MENRRNFIGKLGAFSVISIGGFRTAFASTKENKKFILIVLRGAMDGLSAVPPLFDTDYASLRGGLTTVKYEMI